jgi:hypothetical protein
MVKFKTMNERELKEEIRKAFNIRVLLSIKSSKKDVYFFEYDLLSPIQAIKIVYDKKTSKFKLELRTINVSGIIIKDDSFEKIKIKSKEIYGFKCRRIKNGIVIKTKWIEKEDVGNQVVNLVLLSNDVNKELFND